MYYSAIGILAFLILLFEHKDFLLKRNRISRTPAGKAYRQFLFAVLIYYLTDIVWGWFEAEKWASLLFADTTVYFIAMAAGVLCWTRSSVIYLGERGRFSRFILYAGRIFAGAVTVISVANCFTPLLFTVDQSSVYRALDLRYAVLITQILLLLLVSTHAFGVFFRLRGTMKKGNRYRTVGLFGLIKSIFLITQLWFPYLPLYTIAYMLGTSLLHAFVISDEENETRSRLSDADKIRQLQESVSTLLDNMPALSFYKDAETGAYIACNQAFAEYAHKENPQGVIGLTDADIFDEVTARHFMEDDKTALSMDRPYIFFEDVPDAAGIKRQFQTTKLKFVDPSGRLRLLGMCQDVTDREQIRRAEERIQEERIAYTRISALAGDFIAIFIVDPESRQYREYNASLRNEGDVPMREGADFFNDLRNLASELVWPDDLEGYLHTVTEENILNGIRERGVFALTHRITAGGQPRYVQFRTAMVEEKGGRRLIAGINDIDTQVRQEAEYRKRLSQAQAQAAVDALTGVKNKHSYLKAEEKMNRLIAGKNQPPFAISVLDVNNLKKINDTAGHQAGDDCLLQACRLICRTFKHSPVFRVGGDEFVVISQGEDYVRVEELTALISAHNQKALRSGGVVVACGMSRFDGDDSVAAVFERADRMMYENKSLLKASGL